jgi:hypothetical protein
MRRLSAHAETIDNPLIVIAVSSLFVLILALQVDPLTTGHPAFSLGGDHTAYIAMAEAPGEAHASPYCYRVLMPFIARILPFGLQTSFYMLTLIFITGTGVLMYYLLRTSGEGVFFSFMGIVLFYSLNWGAKFALYDFWLTEPMLFFFITLSLLLLLLGRDAWLALALGLAVLSKESAIFFLPLVYAIKADRPLDGKAFLRTAAVGVAPIGFFLLLRWTIPSSTGYDPLALLSTIGTERLSSGLIGFIRGGTVGTWGILLLALPFFSGRDGGKLAIRSAPFLVFVYMQPFFAVNVDRLLVMAFIVVIPLAVGGLRRIASKMGLSLWMTAGYAFVPFILIVLKGGYQSPSPEQRLLALALWTIPVAAVKRYHKRKNPAEHPVDRNKD